MKHKNCDINNISVNAFYSKKEGIFKIHNISLKCSIADFFKKVSLDN